MAESSSAFDVDPEVGAEGEFLKAQIAIGALAIGFLLGILVARRLLEPRGRR